MKFLSLLISLFIIGNIYAQTEFDPEYETIKSRVSYVPGIKVIRGKTTLIIPVRESFCPNGTVFKFNNGDIQVYDRRSSDGGNSWTEAEYILEASTYQYPEPDGEVIMFRSHDKHPFHIERGIPVSGRPEIRIIKTEQEGIFEAIFFRSDDNGITWEKDVATIYLPEEFIPGVICRKIVRIEDGSLLVSITGRCKRKNVEGRCVSVIRSVDRGKTWHYFSAVSFGSTRGIISEGFSETSLLVLSDNKILSFMRSGTSYQSSLGSHNNNDTSAIMPFSYHKSTPVYMSKSIDGGKTWSNANPVTEKFGVWPDAVQLENGIIAMSYGRPGNWIMFSNDEGESWGPVLQFYNDLYPPDCGNYFSLAEVAPNILLVAYPRTDPNNHWNSEIVGTYFHVKRIRH